MNNKLNKRISFACDEHKLYYEEFHRQSESDECQMIKTATSNLGFSKNFLLKKSKKHDWAKEMIELFKSATKDWKDNGNHPTAVKFEQELKIMKESGEEPISRVLCKRVGVHEAYLISAPSYAIVWRKNLYTKFKKIRIHWEKTGGADYKKCKKALKATIKKGDLPTKTGVVKDASYPPKYLLSSKYPWKLKLIAEIEQATLEWNDKKGCKEIERL